MTDEAVVLAAGEGRRLRPLTSLRPKPMVPVGNRPILEHVVEALAGAGVDEVVFVVGYRRERIQTYFGDGDDWGVDIEYVVQEKQLGTGHALLQAEDAVGGDFLVVNGDSIVDSTLVSALVSADSPAVAVTRSDQPTDYGVVDVDDGTVAGIHEKPRVYDAETETINAGVYRLDERVFDEIRSRRAGGETSLTEALVALAHRYSVDAVRVDGWTDVSHLWDLIRVNSEVTAEGGVENADVHPTAYVADDVALGEDATVGPNATILPGTALGDNATVGAGAVVANSVLFSDARVGENAVVRDCAVGEDARLGPNATVEGGHADVVVAGELYEGVRLGGVVGDHSVVAGGASLEPGTVLGNDVGVGTGTVVDGRVESGTEVRR
jgi:glucose-1-phosphate thymidylyltransferase